MRAAGGALAWSQRLNRWQRLRVQQRYRVRRGLLPGLDDRWAGSGVGL